MSRCNITRFSASVMNNRHRDNNDFKKTGGGLVVLFFFLSTILVPSIVADAAHKDSDDYGLFRNYNCDNSMEGSIAYDYSDDYIWKMFYVSQYEYDKSTHAQVWIYAKCFGTKVETTSSTHRITNYWGTSLTYDKTTLFNFKSYEWFDYDDYHWQMFEFEKNLLKPDQWNRIQIRDLDRWTQNNIRIGIDKTYGGIQGDPDAKIIEDFDQSYWYSGGAQVTPQDPTENEGELMIKLELKNRQTVKRFIPYSNYNPWSDYYPYSFIPIDQSDDAVAFYFDLSRNDRGASRLARIHVFGYSWIEPPGAPPTVSQFYLEINDHYTFNMYPDYDHAQTRPIGHWAVELELDPQEFFNIGPNKIKISEQGSDIERHNLAILYFPTIDNDKSAWYYNKGQGQVGSPDLVPEECQGELAIFVELYHKEESKKRVGGIILGCDDHGTGDCAWDCDFGLHGRMSFFISNLIVKGQHNIDPATDFNGLKDKGWEDHLIVDGDTGSNPHAKEGDVYSEGSKDGLLQGDRVDLLFIDSHGGLPGLVRLEDNPFGVYGYDEALDSGKTTNKDLYWAHEEYPYPETDNWDWESSVVAPPNFDWDASSYSGYSEDGWNLHCDWIVSFACNFLASTDYQNELEPNNPWQFALYHGVHAMIGFMSAFVINHGNYLEFATALVDNWINKDMSFIDGFTEAVDDKLDDWDGTTPINRWIVYYNNAYRYEIIDKDTYSSDSFYGTSGEPRNIKCLQHPHGLD